MQLFCRSCGHPVAVSQYFCGICGTKLKTDNLNQPTQGRFADDGSASRVFVDDASAPGVNSALFPNAYPITLDDQNYFMASMAVSRTYSAIWPTYPSSVFPQTMIPSPPVTSLPNTSPGSLGPATDIAAISQEKTHILTPPQKGNFSRRKVLRSLVGLSVLLAAGLGAGVVISSRQGAGAASSAPQSKAATRANFSAVPIYTYTGHHAPVNGVIWEPITPAGSNAFRVASCASDVQIWGGLDGSKVTAYDGYQGEVSSVSWCHSTNKIVSGNVDGTAHIWLAATGQYVNRLVGHNAAIRGVAWAKDGVHIATASDDMQVGLWPLDTQHNDASSPTFFQNHTNAVYAVSFSDDSQYLVSGSADRTAMIWRVQDHTYQAAYSGHQGAVRTVAVAPGPLPSAGLLSASGGEDQSAQVWTWDPHSKTFHLLARYNGHRATVNTLAWSPDGSRIASGDSLGQVHIWQSQTGELLLSFQAHHGAVQALAWSPEGQYLASAGQDHAVHVTRISCTAFACISR